MSNTLPSNESSSTNSPSIKERLASSGVKIVCVESSAAPHVVAPVRKRCAFFEISLGS